jgi:hypothetical protein
VARLYKALCRKHDQFLDSCLSFFKTCCQRTATGLNDKLLPSRNFIAYIQVVLLVSLAPSLILWWRVCTRRCVENMISFLIRVCHFSKLAGQRTGASLNHTLLPSRNFIAYTQVVLLVSLAPSLILWWRVCTRRCVESMISFLIRVCLFQNLLPMYYNESEGCTSFKHHICCLHGGSTSGVIGLLIDTLVSLRYKA